MDYGWLLKTPIAHRGIHNNKNVPENSLLAIELSIENNFPIEIDVQMTLDKKIIVMHDDNLMRMCGVDKSVINSTYEEISGLHLLNTDEKVPLLTEVLERLGGRQPVLIEIKNDKLNGAMEQEFWKILSKYKGRFAVQSFNPMTVNWFRKNAPQTLRGQLSSAFKDEKIPAHVRIPLQYMAFNSISKPHFIAYDVSCLPFRPLEKYRERRIPVLAWTIKSQKDLITAQKYADNYIFEGIHIDI